MATRAGFLAALLLVALWLSGCQLVLGDFEVEDAPQGKTAQCSDKHRCNGPWLFCETKSGDDYRLIDTCASEVQCDSMAGRCTVCMPGEFRCTGARLESCDVNGTAWSLVTECPTADQCNLNSRSCRPCTPGEMPQCRGAEQLELSECGPDGDWVSLGVCATQLLCQRSAQAIAADPMTPRQCEQPACPEPGAFRCEADGVSLSRCAPDLTAWTPVDTCASADLCTATVADPVGADARGAKCLMPGCFPAGAVQCVEERLERCPDSLLAWGHIETCELPYQCNTNAEACTGPCTPGDLQCNGAILQRCSDAELWADDATCVNASLCQVTEDPVTLLHVGGCVEPTCLMPGEVRCDGALLERCNTEQTDWEDVETCRSAALCNEIDETCDPVGCEPAGGLRCNPANASELQSCPDDLTIWQSVTVCAETEACNTDLNAPCISQCPPSPERCSDVAYETCSGVTGAPVWTGQATCQTADLCNCGLSDTCAGGYAPDGACGLPVCGANLGSTRCMGSRVETCQPGRNGWNTVTVDCGTAAMCIPGTPADVYFNGSYCAVCSVGSERQCNGATVRTCSADRRAWVSTAPCPITTCINSGTMDYCAECAQGNSRCSSGDVQTCGANSLWSGGTLTDCGAFACVQNGNTAFCGVCTPGHTRCSNGDVQTCAMNSTWGAVTDCGTFACVENGDADFCGVCIPGQTRCTAGGDTQLCGANSTWVAGTDCGAFACVDDGDADYCGVCTAGHTRCTTGGDTQVCGANLQWGTGEDCGAFACVDNGNADYCGECTAGHTRCTGGGDTQLCGANLRWGPGEDCGSFACVDDGNADYCGECTAGHTRCTVVGAGGDTQVCGTNLLWGAGDDCGTFACVDDGNADYCGQCTAGHTRCTVVGAGGDTQVCGTDLLWGAGDDCETFACVDDGNADYCGECTPGHTRCMSGDVQTCGANSLWGAVTDCGAFACVESGNADYCGECTAGHTRCTVVGAGGDTEVCGTTTLLWGAGADCGTFACYDDGTADYCGECTPGETACSGASLLTCGVDGAWDAGMACALGCVDDTGNADYCADCTVDVPCAEPMVCTDGRCTP